MDDPPGRRLDPWFRDVDVVWTYIRKRRGAPGNCTGSEVQDLVGALASLEISLRGSVNALRWSNPILYALLALGMPGSGLYGRK